MYQLFLLFQFWIKDVSPHKWHITIKKILIKKLQCQFFRYCKNGYCIRLAWILSSTRPQNSSLRQNVKKSGVLQNIQKGAPPSSMRKAQSILERHLVAKLNRLSRKQSSYFVLVILKQFQNNLFLSYIQTDI